MALPKGNQIAAARALLGWDQKDIAERIGVTVAAISKIEKGDNKGKASTLEKIQTVLELAGIEFTANDGVCKKHQQIKVLQGRDDFAQFFNDVYNTVKTHPNADVCITSINEADYVFWHKERSPMHRARMAKLKKPPLRVLVAQAHEKDLVFDYCVYRVINNFSLNTSMYIYGNKSAFIQFTKDDVIATIVDNEAIADSMRRLFNSVWDSAAELPS